MHKPRLFAELPAGLASVSLRLHGGPHCRPPISRMGSKVGYAEVILAALGLRSGQDADRYLWAEADLDVAALLRCYPDAGMLRRVAEIIRGWKDEEPRALWERLRAERKARGPRLDAEGTAGWMWTSAIESVRPGSFCGEFRALGPTAQEHTGPTTCAKYARENGVDERGYPLAPQGRSRGEVADACHRLAEYAMVAGNSWHGQGDHWREPNGARANTAHDRERRACNLTTGTAAERFEGMAREVAGFAAEVTRTHQGGGGYRAPEAPATECQRRTKGMDRQFRYDPEDPAPSMERLAEAAEGMAREVAEDAMLTGWSLKGPNSGYYAGPGHAPDSRSLTLGGAADRFEGMAREVAGWIQVSDRSVAQDPTCFKPTAHGPGNDENPEGLALRMARATSGGWPEVVVLTRIPEPADVAAWLGTPGDLERTFIYMDPDYVGTTGYVHTFPRAEVVRIALAYSAMGATVAVSEAVPVEELVAAGWHAADIAGGRKGQKRTFARVATEALTMNREPAHRVASQVGLFGVGAA